MTDMLSTPIWFFLLTWIIRQVENGIEVGGDNNEFSEEDNDNETSSEETVEEDGAIGIEEAEFEPYEPITQAIQIAIAAFSVLLLALSISAYKKTALRRILYAAVAFGLFAIQMFFGITLAILVLFFMAIVRKK